MYSICSYSTRGGGRGDVRPRASGGSFFGWFGWLEVLRDGGLPPIDTGQAHLNLSSNPEDLSGTAGHRFQDF